ncbi:MAG: two-component system, NarL family, sensor histidine kinase BarA [Blastocatellia bacterium]|jgi:signal transduction histidine kinase|nr:two-component system, NarL family, sensor histidine kinase BarA [Blastocatellia bacterium]
MSKQSAEQAAAIAASEQLSPEARLRDLISLNKDILELFYTQSYSPDAICTPAEVCAAFSKILLCHWNLCCIIIHLRDEDGRLRESAMHKDEDLDEERARSIGARMVEAVEQDERELEVWADDGGAEPDVSRAKEREEFATEARQALDEGGQRASVVIPIHARGALVGSLVAITAHPERLRAALDGLRFIAPLIVIAVGNARRAQAVREQHQRIEELVEQSQQRERELEAANRELRHVGHYRSLFLARMSHELRTPLTSMLGFAEILVDYEKLTEKQHRFCEKIQSSGLQLQTSLNQLVDLSRLEAGQSELFLHEFSLRETLRESCAAVGRLAQKQGVQIDCQPEEKLQSIVSDEGKLRQVLYNFFAHAISRSPEQTVVKVRAESSTPMRCLVTIEDEGEPLPDLSRIFEPIDISAPSQSAASMNELGLVIARRLIDALGGAVRLESPASGGLKVSIELPTRPTQG